MSGARPSDISSAIRSLGGAASTRERREHLLLATRERARLLVPPLGEHREHLERAVERVLALGARQREPQLGPEVVAHT